MAINIYFIFFVILPLAEMTAMEYEDNESKFIRKAKENPFVPAGKPFKHYNSLRVQFVSR